MLHRIVVSISALLFILAGALPAAAQDAKPAPGGAAGLGDALKMIDNLSDQVGELEHTLPGRAAKGAIAAYGAARAVAAASAALTSALTSGGPALASVSVDGNGTVTVGTDDNTTGSTGTTGTTATTTSTSTATGTN